MMAKPATRQFIIKLHLIVAAFMFPAVIMFLGTGALYTWGETGDYVDTEYPVRVSEPLTNDKDALTALATAELARRSIALPTGSPSVRTVGDAYRFEWSGANRDVHLSPTADPAIATLTVKETTLHRRLVQLHKAKGSTLFKIYASVLAAALFLLVASGLAVSLITPAYRSMTYWASGAGAVLFLGAIALG
jgi:hypothetical protein